MSQPLNDLIAQYNELKALVQECRLAGKEIYPPQHQLLRCLNECSIDDIKVVIVGQDPYHCPGQANGLSFSVNKGVPIPPSLQNIYKEISADLDIQMPPHGDLTGWARQGVILLNRVLSVEKKKPKSHAGKGWEEFTLGLIQYFNEYHKNLVFMLWGSDAKKVASSISKFNHLTLKAAHPSPLSAYRGFFGCKHFSKANEYLIKHGRVPVDWGDL